MQHEDSQPTTLSSPPWSRTTKTVVSIGLFAALVTAFALLSDSLGGVVVGLLLAFVASYPIRLLERLGAKRGLSILMAYVAILLVGAGVLVLGIPALIRSLDEIDWITIWNVSRDYIIDSLEVWRMFTLFGTTYDLSGVVDPIIEFLSEADPGDAVVLDLERFLEILSTGAGVIFGIVTVVVGSVVQFFVVLVMAFYFSIFLPAWGESIPNLAPAPHREDIRRLLGRMWFVLDLYAGGMVKVGMFIGLVTWIGLTILGVPGALSLAVIAGLLNVIPTLGPLLAGVPGTLVALIQGSTRFEDLHNFWVAIIAVGVYTVVQQVETQFATPRIMGGAVHLSPLTVFLGVIIGLQVYGILGALVAVPTILVTREVFRYVHAKLRDDDPFPEPAEPQAFAALARPVAVGDLPDAAAGPAEDRPGG